MRFYIFNFIDLKTAMHDLFINRTRRYTQREKKATHKFCCQNAMCTCNWKHTCFFIWPNVVSPACIKMFILTKFSIDIKVTV